MFRLAEGHEGPLKLRMGITLTPADGVWVTAHPRHTSSTAAAT